MRKRGIDLISNWRVATISRVRAEREHIESAKPTYRQGEKKEQEWKDFFLLLLLFSACISVLDWPPPKLLIQKKFDNIVVLDTVTGEIGKVACNYRFLSFLSVLKPTKLVILRTLSVLELTKLVVLRTLSVLELTKLVVLKTLSVLKPTLFEAINNKSKENGKKLALIFSSASFFLLIR